MVKTSSIDVKASLIDADGAKDFCVLLLAWHIVTDLHIMYLYDITKIL